MLWPLSYRRRVAGAYASLWMERSLNSVNAASRWFQPGSRRDGGMSGYAEFGTRPNRDDHSSGMRLSGQPDPRFRLGSNDVSSRERWRASPALVMSSGETSPVTRHQVGSRNPDTRFDRVTTLVQYGAVALLVMLLRGLTMPRPIPVPIRQTMFRLWKQG